MSPSDPRRVTMPVTMACPVCGDPFDPIGRRRSCSGVGCARRRAAITAAVRLPPTIAATQRAARPLPIRKPARIGPTINEMLHIMDTVAL